MKVYVDEVLESAHMSEGYVWDGFADHLDAVRLFYWLLPLVRSTPPRLKFKSEWAWWSEEFFAHLVHMASHDPEVSWFTEALKRSDLRDDPELMRHVWASVP